jgi:hypothetical protein
MSKMVTYNVASSALRLKNSQYVQLCGVTPTTDYRRMMHGIPYTVYDILVIRYWYHSDVHKYTVSSESAVSIFDYSLHQRHATTLPHMIIHNSQPTIEKSKVLFDVLCLQNSMIVYDSYCYSIVHHDIKYIVHQSTTPYIIARAYIASSLTITYHLFISKPAGLEPPNTPSVLFTIYESRTRRGAIIFTFYISDSSFLFSLPVSVI